MTEVTTSKNNCNTRWEKTHDRIVGGYDTRENKPWAARIWFDEKNYLVYEINMIYHIGL